MEDSEVKADVSKRLKIFQRFVCDLRKMEFECDVGLIYDEFMQHTSSIRDIILFALNAKLASITEEINKSQTKKRRDYVTFEKYEARQQSLKAMIAEKDEIQGEIEEHCKKMEILIKDMEMIKLIKSGTKISRSGIHLIGIAIIKELTRISKALPIYAKRSAIVELVKNNQFIVLKGETGSGKSTQLVQYVMEEVSRSGNTKVICTQPRKVAAISLARRIAEEQLQPVGEQIGYWVGMNKCYNEKTTILLMTDQMLLNHCLENPRLDGISCIIIDEAHERSINIDLLLGMVKSAAKDKKDLKVIVTSATISTSLFSHYFDDCPYIQIPGRMYPVEVVYDDNEECKDYVKRAVSKAIEIHKHEGAGDILVFLTTPVEVDNAVEAFAKASRDVKRFTVLPLHGKLQPDQQMRVFQPCENGKRKIVFSTNVAETSVTIPGIKYVIDCGMVKEKFYDAKKGTSYLEVKMVSKSSAIQRMGRAGRTGPGLCVRLYSKSCYDNLEESTLPEIKKMHLGSAVLRLMALGISDVKAFDFIEKPTEASLTNSINVLKMLGAIDERGKITRKGEILAKLPLEPRAAKIVLDGIEGGCKEEAVHLAAALAYSSNVFFRPVGDEERKLSEEAKVQFCNKEGDLFTLLEIYEEWKKQSGTKGRNRWCCQKYLNAKTMRSMKELVDEINFSLEKIPIRALNAESKSYEMKQKYLKEIFISAHYDNIAAFTGHERVGYWSPKLDERFLIHPSSVLCVLAMQPDFVVFQDVLKTSANFITGITPVEKKSVESLCPMDPLAIDFDKVEENKLTEIKRFPLGPLVIRSLIGRGGENIKRIEALITDQGIAPGHVEMNVEERKVAVYASKMRQYFAENLIKNRISEEMRSLEEEMREEDFGQEKTGYRVLMKAGGEVQEILTQSESRVLVIEVRRSIANEVTEAKILENISNEINKRINEVKDVRNIKRESKDTDYGVKWGQITFSKLEALETARSKFNFTSSGYIVQAFAQTHLSHHKSFVTVKVLWSRRESATFGFIKCISEGAVSSVLPMVQMKYCAKLDRKNPLQIYVRNLDCNLANEEFKKSVEELVQGTENKVDSYIVYKKTMNTHCEEETRDYEKQLKGILNETSFESIKVFPIKNEQTVTCTALVMCNTIEDAENIAFRLNGSNIIGKQLCRASIVLRQEFFCSVNIFESIKTEINEIMVMCKNSTTTISIKDGKRKSTKIIIISGEDSFLYKVIFRRLLDLLEGEIIEELNVSLLQYNLMSQRIKNAEKEIPNGKIDYDKKRGKFRIYGNPETRKRLKNKLQEIQKSMDGDKEIKINLKDKGMKPGLMKGLMTKYGPRLQEMIPSKDCGTLELNIRKQVISVLATSDVITVVSNLVNEYNDQLQETSDVELHQNETEGDTCLLCLCKIEESKFILQSCGHPYCKQCLKQYIESSVRDKKFPINCCEEDCERPLILKDFDLLIESKTEKASFVEAAVDDFVMKNPRSYKYCPTPNCRMVYRKSDVEMARAFQCPDCGKETCTVCHQNGHSVFQSCAAYRAYLDNSDLFAWAENKDCRKCPKCDAMIEKNGGCLHVACKCGAHLCWGCMAVFSNSNDCYGHQSSCSRKPPPQTYRLPQASGGRLDNGKGAGATAHPVGAQSTGAIDQSADRTRSGYAYSTIGVYRTRAVDTSTGENLLSSTSNTTGVYRTRAVDTSTGENRLSATSNTTGVYRTRAVDTSIGQNRSSATSNTTGVIRTRAVDTSTGQNRSSATSNTTGVIRTRAVDTSTGQYCLSATSNTTGVYPTRAVDTSIGQNRSSATSNTTGVYRTRAVDTSTGQNRSSATSNTTGVYPTRAVDTSIGQNRSSATSNTTGVYLTRAVDTSTGQNRSSATSNTTGVIRTRAVDTSTGQYRSSATSNTTGVIRTRAVDTSTGQYRLSATSNTTGVYPTRAVDTSIGQNRSSATSNTTGVYRTRAVDTSTGQNRSSATSNTTGVYPTRAVDTSIGQYRSSATSNTTGVYRTRAVDTSIGQNRLSATSIRMQPPKRKSKCTIS